MVADLNAKVALGMVCDAYDPYFGEGRFIYLKSGAAMDPGRLVTFDNTFTTADVPNTANTGSPFVVARTIFDAANEYGWFQMEGMAPVQAAASVAAGAAVGVGGAGQAGTNTAGKQLLGVRVVQPSTFTLTKLGLIQIISKNIGVNGTDGLFKGLAVSGTGIAGGSTIALLGASGRDITLNNTTTAIGSPTLTFTYTGFILVFLSNPFVQGAIT
jgi:hypothetical protein